MYHLHALPNGRLWKSRQILAGVKPGFSSSTLAGVEYPKRSSPKILPLGPTRLASVNSLTPACRHAPLKSPLVNCFSH